MCITLSSWWNKLFFSLVPWKKCVKRYFDKTAPFKKTWDYGISVCSFPIDDFLCKYQCNFIHACVQVPKFFCSDLHFITVDVHLSVDCSAVICISFWLFVSIYIILAIYKYLIVLCNCREQLFIYAVYTYESVNSMVICNTSNVCIQVCKLCGNSLHQQQIHLPSNLSVVLLRKRDNSLLKNCLVDPVTY